MFVSRETEIIIKLLQIPGIGNRIAEKIIQNLLDMEGGCDDDLSLRDFINMCSCKGIIKLNKKITGEHIEIAIEKYKEIIDKSSALGIKIISKFDNNFPLLLKKLVDSNGKDISPIILNYKGDIDKLNKCQKKSVAIVGTRKPTQEGVEACRYYSQYFAERGYNIVSGLALGCDTVAHQGALSVHGMTTAILAHGLQMISPKANELLSRQILDNGGLLLSEYFVGSPAYSTYFVERDRLQAGLSFATIVIQAGIKSGTMHAARTAINNNRILACVRYKDEVLWNSEKLQGNNLLINQGAYNLRKVEDFESFIEAGGKMMYVKYEPELKFKMI